MGILSKHLDQCCWCDDHLLYLQLVLHALGQTCHYVHVACQVPSCSGDMKTSSALLAQIAETLAQLARDLPKRGFPKFQVLGYQVDELAKYLKLKSVPEAVVHGW